MSYFKICNPHIVYGLYHFIKKSQNKASETRIHQKKVQVSLLPDNFFWWIPK